MFLFPSEILGGCSSVYDFIVHVRGFVRNNNQGLLKYWICTTLSLTHTLSNGWLLAGPGKERKEQLYLGRIVARQRGGTSVHIPNSYKLSFASYNYTRKKEPG